MIKITRTITPSQTIGPFPHEAWQWAADLTAQIEGQAVTIRGIIYDGHGDAVNDAQIEAWLPDAAAGAEACQGHAMPGFRRVPSGEDGSFTLRAARSLVNSPDASAGEPLLYGTVVRHRIRARPGLAPVYCGLP